MNFRSRLFVATLFLALAFSHFHAPIKAQNESAILGRIFKYERDPQTGYMRDRGPVFGVEVILQGQQGTFSTWTDNNGLYRFPDLAPGTYTVICKPLDLFLIVGPVQHVVELRRGQEAPINFTLRANGRIAGRVFGEGGIPIVGMRVDLVPVEQKDSAVPHAIWTMSQDDGKYILEGIAPGRYLLGIRLDSSESDFPYPRTYYNGATEPSSATVLELKEGQKLEDLDLLLPYPLQRRTISGMVQFRDRPVAGAWVSLKMTEYPYVSPGSDIQCDQQGRFSFRAFAGLRYSAVAVGSLAAGGEGIGRSDIVRLPALGDVDLRLDIVPSRQPPNLLLNPDASQGSSYWKAFGSAMVETAAGHENCFSVRHKGYFLQDVFLPEGAEGQYAVLLGLASSERIHSDGTITGLPYLYGYMMADLVRINAYLQGQQMLGSETQPDKWGPVYGIFIVPPGTTVIRYFLNQAETRGVPQNGSAARFADLGLYLLPTELEAKVFVQNHFNFKTN